MSDDLRDVFDESLGAVPVPPASVEDATLRGRGLARRRSAMMLLSVIVLLVTVAFVVQSWGDESRPVGPSDDSTASSDADQTALRVIDDLGPMCQGYDFYYKTAISGSEFRPVQCGMEMDYRIGPAPIPSASPSPSPTPGQPSPRYPVVLVRGARLVVYAFDERAGKENWIEHHVAPWGGRLAGPRWVVDVMDGEFFTAIRDELNHPQRRVLATPARTWTYGDHVLAPTPGGFEPDVPLRRASRRLAPFVKEVLGARLGMYSDATVTEPVAAWVIAHRKCIPQYGGRHASDDCTGDQLYVVIDATSGRTLTSFSN